MERQRSTPTKSLQRALDILGAFIDEQRELGVSELARLTGMSKGTVHRLVSTLVQNGYLEQNPVTQAYLLGLRALELGMAYRYQNPLQQIARTVFETYSARFEHNFYLGMREGVDVVYLEVLDGRGPIKVSVLAGARAPAHATALGKALLAALADDAIRQLYRQNPLVARTDRTLTDIEALIGQLNQVRDQGYATNFGENIANVHAVGAPVRDSSDRIVAGVSLAYPGPLVEEDRVPELIALVREIAGAVSSRLGAPAPGSDEGRTAVSSSMEKGVY